MVISKREKRGARKRASRDEEPPVVSQQEWEAARQQLLVKEKALTRSSFVSRISAIRRYQLPSGN